MDSTFPVHPSAHAKLIYFSLMQYKFLSTSMNNVREIMHHKPVSLQLGDIVVLRAPECKGLCLCGYPKLSFKALPGFLSAESEVVNI